MYGDNLTLFEWSLEPTKPRSIVGEIEGMGEVHGAVNRHLHRQHHLRALGFAPFRSHYLIMLLPTRREKIT